MIKRHLPLSSCAAGLLAVLTGGSALAQAGPAPAVPPGLTVVATTHAQGAQIYECRAGADGRLSWAFREPVATLLEEGRTVGRHYAGPSWELADGGHTVVGRVAERLPGAGTGDIPWLRLEVTERRGAGHGRRLGPVTVILRVNTAGGVAEGPCPMAGAFRAVPYAADYVFLAPSGGG
ncbi:DUF3455 domain-containing protein [Sabulicella glaciei]|uniref:DUF3455 domain-containing protein n=1 Tax=Sabulicella glaciei TaxID=2984948 RepID=A0ABT3NYV0_9PROT|nr:DUF3455 domain-containing protein [Roseococcus sp. MDT2-1-1]MCW8087340.1 DUF3455 domain-containing protein [Roseococcus sp. MDT2-1-1]